MFLPAKSPALAWPESLNAPAMRRLSTCAYLILMQVRPSEMNGCIPTRSRHDDVMKALISHRFEVQLTGNAKK